MTEGDKTGTTRLNRSNRAGWDIYAPPVRPIGSTLNPRMYFDLDRPMLRLCKDSMTHLASWKIMLLAHPKTFQLRIVPIFSIEAGGARIHRTGLVNDSKWVMTWLRVDFNHTQHRSGFIPLLPKNDGTLEGEYTPIVSRRAARLAKNGAGADGDFHGVGR